MTCFVNATAHGQPRLTLVNHGSIMVVFGRELTFWSINGGFPHLKYHKHAHDKACEKEVIAARPIYAYKVLPSIR